MRIPLILPSIASTDTKVIRSSFSLLRRNGDLCIRGEPLAYCIFNPTKRSRLAEDTFGTYADDLFAVIVAPADGVVHWEPGVSRQGWSDLMTFVQPLEWEQESLLGTLTTQNDGGGQPLAPADSILIANGRRMFEWADMRGGLLSGWYEFIRAWRFAGELSSVSFATTCSHRYSVLGDQRLSHELLLGCSRPLHLTYFADTLLLPTAQSLREELEWTPAEREQILRELHASVGSFDGKEAANSGGLISLMLRRVEQGSPFLQTYKVLQSDGVKEVPFPGTVVLSTASEEARVLKHKTLPLTLALPQFFRLPAEVASLCDENFVLLEPPSAEQIEANLRVVARTLRARGALVFVMNSFVSEAGKPLVRPAWVADVKRTKSYRAGVSMKCSSPWKRRGS